MHSTECTSSYEGVTGVRPQRQGVKQAHTGTTRVYATTRNSASNEGRTRDSVRGGIRRNAGQVN